MSTFCHPRRAGGGRSSCCTAVLGALLACLIAGCVPPELSEATDTGTQPQASFGEVADIVAQTCATTSACHDGASSTNFVVEGGTAASEEQVRAALEDVDSLAGIALVVPGDAEASALYQRVIADGPKRMPPTVPLEEEEIETIRLWIESGAQYE